MLINYIYYKSMQTPDLLPNRLNFDAVIFCGCTMKEMQVIAISCLAFCIITMGFLTKLLINMFLIGTGLAFPVGIGMSWGVALFAQRIKHGKPKGYMKQRFLLWCEDRGFVSAIYVRRSGKWSVGRAV